MNQEDYSAINLDSPGATITLHEVTTRLANRLLSYASTILAPVLSRIRNARRKAYSECKDDLMRQCYHALKMDETARTSLVAALDDSYILRHRLCVAKILLELSQRHVEKLTQERDDSKQDYDNLSQQHDNLSQEHDKCLASLGHATARCFKLEQEKEKVEQERDEFAAMAEELIAEQEEELQLTTPSDAHVQSVKKMAQLIETLQRLVATKEDAIKVLSERVAMAKPHLELLQRRVRAMEKVYNAVIRPGPAHRTTFQKSKVAGEYTMARHEREEAALSHFLHDTKNILCFDEETSSVEGPVLLTASSTPLYADTVLGGSTVSECSAHLVSP